MKTETECKIEALQQRLAKVEHNLERYRQGFKYLDLEVLTTVEQTLHLAAVSGDLTHANEAVILVSSATLPQIGMCVSYCKAMLAKALFETQIEALKQTESN
jgi:hypothetical protein